ncbi:MAG: Nif3-like dinuclear metal center hexameric protein [Planctomycetota bacterium]
MELNDVMSVLSTVAPEHLAEDWDQVGLHLAGNGKAVRQAMLCIDLTPAVLDEAIASRCQLIVAYHPPIFHPLKRLADRDWKEKMLAKAVRKGIAVYSPHTALDAVREGMNDWLCEGLGKANVRGSIGPPKHGPSGHYKVVVYVPREAAAQVRSAMFRDGGGTIGEYFDCSFNLEGIGTFQGGEGTNPAIGKPGRAENVEELRIEMVCWPDRLGSVLKAARKAHPYEEPAIDVYQLFKELPPEDEEQTPGRVVVLKKAVPAKTLITRVKKTLGLNQVKASVPQWYGPEPRRMMNPMTMQEIKLRDPQGNERTRLNEIQTIAVCVGAGGSLFEKYPHADAYLTGEMQHHQILDLYQKGKVVILAGHTNTERPFLGRYRDRILASGGEKVDWLISEADRPLMQIV